MRAAVPALIAALAVAGCSAQGPSAPIVPPLPQETLPLPPVSPEALIWQPGDWSFVSGSYRYESGRYVAAAGHGHSWLFAHWVQAGDQYAWVPGAWDRAPTAPGAAE